MVVGDVSWLFDMIGMACYAIALTRLDLTTEHALQELCLLSLSSALVTEVQSV